MVDFRPRPCRANGHHRRQPYNAFGNKPSLYRQVLEYSFDQSVHDRVGRFEKLVLQLLFLWNSDSLYLVVGPS
jgi:hypothetical protein